MTEVLPSALWSRHQRDRLVRVCTAIVRDPVAAEDLAQETLLEAWRQQHKLVDPDGASRWLDAIARHVCRRWLSAQGRLPRPDTDTMLESIVFAATAADVTGTIVGC